MMPRNTLSARTTRSSFDSPGRLSSQLSSNSNSHYRLTENTAARRHSDFMRGFELTREFTSERKDMLQRFRDEEQLQERRNRMARESLLEVRGKALDAL